MLWRLFCVLVAILSALPAASSYRNNCPGIKFTDGAEKPRMAVAAHWQVSGDAETKKRRDLYWPAFGDFVLMPHDIEDSKRYRLKKNVAGQPAQEVPPDYLMTFFVTRRTNAKPPTLTVLFWPKLIREETVPVYKLWLKSDDTRRLNEEKERTSFFGYHDQRCAPFVSGTRPYWEKVISTYADTSTWPLSDTFNASADCDQIPRTMPYEWTDLVRQNDVLLIDRLLPAVHGIEGWIYIKEADLRNDTEESLSYYYRGRTGDPSSDCKILTLEGVNAKRSPLIAAFPIDALSKEAYYEELADLRVDDRMRDYSLELKSSVKMPPKEKVVFSQNTKGVRLQKTTKPSVEAVRKTNKVVFINVLVVSLGIAIASGAVAVLSWWGILFGPKKQQFLEVNDYELRDHMTF